MDDLFGDRFFPVAKFDLTTTSLDIAECMCDHFKGHSKPIIYQDRFAFIGIRCKPSELYNIHDLYEVGGTILINEEFDW